MITRYANARGFRAGAFNDANGVECTIQESSSAEVPKIWLGANELDLRYMAEGKGWIPLPWFSGRDFVANTRMHLTQEQVRELLPLLTHFADRGTLP